MSDAYQALIHCLYSRRDINGNCYWLATWSNPADQRCVTGEVASPGNARTLAAYAICGSEETKYGRRAKGYVHAYCTEEELPIRLWNRKAKPVRDAKLYEGSKELSEALEKLFRPLATA